MVNETVANEARIAGKAETQTAAAFVRSIHATHTHTHLQCAHQGHKHAIGILAVFVVLEPAATWRVKHPTRSLVADPLQG